MSRVASSDASRLEKDLEMSMKRVEEVERNCEKLLGNVKQLNEELIEVRKERDLMSSKLSKKSSEKEESEAQTASNSEIVAQLRKAIQEVELKNEELVRNK